MKHLQRNTFDILHYLSEWTAILHTWYYFKLVYNRLERVTVCYRKAVAVCYRKANK